MDGTVRTDATGLVRRAWRQARVRVVECSPIRVAREVRTLTFRGSRAQLERATALRLQAVIVLLFLAVRCVHLGQAGVDLALAGRQYTVGWLALALGAACAVESGAVAVAVLSARRLTPGAMAADAAFGVCGLAAMAFAAGSGPGRAGSLNWMLPYTVATATGLGALAGGDLVVGIVGGGSEGERVRRGAGVWRRLWPLLSAVGLSIAFLACAYLPHRLTYDRPEQIWSDAANYLVFFAAGGLTLKVARRRVNVLAERNAEATAAAAEVAQAAQWRAVAHDVFGPAIALFERVASLPDGELPPDVRDQAGRLIGMIEAVRPQERGGAVAEPGVGAPAP
jgi:hypothetical protein